MVGDPPPRIVHRVAAGATVLALLTSVVAALLLWRSDPGPDGPLWGANYSDLATVDESLYEGRAEAARIFFQGLAGERWSASGGVREAMADGVRTFVISWKERDPDAVRTFLATIPDDLTVYASFNHEPENDGGEPGSARYQAWSAEWRRLWAEQSPIIRAEGLIPTSILMAYTLDQASGRSISDWTLPRGTVDVFAFDGYLDQQDPVELVARVSAAVEASGFARTGLAETGIRVTDSSATNDLRALKAELTKAGNFEWALYWNSAKPDFDYRLDAEAADIWFG